MFENTPETSAYYNLSGEADKKMDDEGGRFSDLPMALAVDVLTNMTWDHSPQSNGNARGSFSNELKLDKRGAMYKNDAKDKHDARWLSWLKKSFEWTGRDIQSAAKFVVAVEKKVISAIGKGAAERIKDLATDIISSVLPEGAYDKEIGAINFRVGSLTPISFTVDSMNMGLKSLKSAGGMVMEFNNTKSEDSPVSLGATFSIVGYSESRLKVNCDFWVTKDSLGKHIISKGHLIFSGGMYAKLGFGLELTKEFAKTIERERLLVCHLDL